MKTALRVVFLVAAIAAVGVALCSPAAGVERVLRVFTATRAPERCEEGAPAQAFANGPGGIRRGTRCDRAMSAPSTAR